MNASRSSRSERRQSFSSGWIGMVKKPSFIETLHESFRPSHKRVYARLRRAMARAGIHNHDTHDKRNDEQNRTCGGYGFRAHAGACHRAGPSGPDPLGAPRNDQYFSHHAISRHAPLRSVESNTASSAATV